MKQKSLMKRITGSREALLAIVLIVLFCDRYSDQPIIPDTEVTDGYAEE